MLVIIALFLCWNPLDSGESTLTHRLWCLLRYLHPMTQLSLSSSWTGQDSGCLVLCLHKADWQQIFSGQNIFHIACKLNRKCFFFFIDSLIWLIHPLVRPWWYLLDMATLAALAASLQILLMGLEDIDSGRSLLWVKSFTEETKEETDWDVSVD